MRTIAKNIFQFSELSDAAKEKARAWFRSTIDCSDYSEHVIEDAKRMAELMGIDIDNIYFSGFSCQGDGACFEGSYRYKKGGSDAIKSECSDPELIRIASGLQDVQRKNFYKIYAVCEQRGHYYHAYAMSVNVEDSENQYRDIGEYESDITELLRDFANWIYKNLESEFDYVNSDSYIDESMEANEYEFCENGARYA